MFNDRRAKALFGRWMNIYSLLMISGLIFVFMLYIRGNTDIIMSYNYFSTARGVVDIEEINRNVFEEYGYTLIKNDLIPVLKKTIPETCDYIFVTWQKVSDNLTFDPPREIPNPQESFLLNGYATYEELYFNNIPRNAKASIKVWEQEFIDEQIRFAKTDPTKVKRSYSLQSLVVYAATKYYDIKGLNGAVIGSLTPWAEVFALANGAKHVTTVDYQKVITEHPQMAFRYALDLAAQREKYYDSFDFVISFSSIEHSGLGRYGDPIDPIGDLREMNKIRCILKPGGLLFLGFAIGTDSVVFNAHRIYGRIRLAMMFEGFQILNVFFNQTITAEERLQRVLNKNSWNGQYMFVLKKI